MRYHVLATDYDGTLAAHGSVDQATLDKLEQVRKSGRRLVLVTGRVIDDLLQVLPRADLFDLIIAENGALLYDPANREERNLGEPPPENFVNGLRKRGIPLSVGKVVVATWVPHEVAVLEEIHRQGLELQVIFNKGAVMVLPTGINKATGLQAGLLQMGLSPRNCVGIGDAENDLAFLSVCECAVAVANALKSTRDQADWVTPSDHGAGVCELMDALLADDLHAVDARISRHAISLGIDAAGAAVEVPPYGGNILLAGSSGGGKSTAATAFLEHLSDRGYQYCIIDPEGDYADLDDALVLGDEQGAPGIDEIMTSLERSDVNLSVNLVNVSMEERPAYFDRLIPRLVELHVRTGRPHWILVDEAHHLLPAERVPLAPALLSELPPLLWITVHPDHLAGAVLEHVDWVLAIGREPGATLRKSAGARQDGAPHVDVRDLDAGEALFWERRNGAAVQRICLHPPRERMRRHKRKYAQGDLGADLSFYFRGPERKLNLSANNLVTFLQIAAGVDDATWEYHLRRGDYSRWFRTSIKDPQLADAARLVERDTACTPSDSRARIRSVVEERYTGPA
jgi:hydroxymethylpyrimidine pyrophosphatase-like HAD family hydrolase